VGSLKELPHAIYFFLSSSLSSSGVTCWDFFWG
jgi:hypothetical protein